MAKPGLHDMLKAKKQQKKSFNQHQRQQIRDKDPAVKRKYEKTLMDIKSKRQKTGDPTQRRIYDKEIRQVERMIRKLS